MLQYNYIYIWSIRGLYACKLCILYVCLYIYIHTRTFIEVQIKCKHTVTDTYIHKSVCVCLYIYLYVQTILTPMLHRLPRAEDFRLLDAGLCGDKDPKPKKATNPDKARALFRVQGFWFSVWGPLNSKN